MILFEDIVRKQVALHRSIQPTDIIKLCYQAVYGAEHLLQNVQRARDLFFDEYSAVCASNGTMIEEISEFFVRVNFAPHKAVGLDPDLLFDAFVKTASEKTGCKTDLNYLFSVIEKLLDEGALPFSKEAWNSAISKYEGGAVHHSQIYRDAESPAYRVVAKKYIEGLE